MPDIDNPFGRTDNRGRIIDPATGKPLRQRTGDTRPFRGKEGKPNRKAARRLASRTVAYEAAVKRGTEHDWHKPGSLK